MKLPKWVHSAGFTMIELLVVIAVIGVLAVAVLSSINPIEQINKGRDTRTRSDAAQLISAVDRYFSTQEVYPWNTSNPTVSYLGLPEYSDAFYHAQTTDASAWNWAQILTDMSEVKPGYMNRVIHPKSADEALLVIKDDVANATMYVCFKPVSNSFQAEAAKNCSVANGATRTTPNVSSWGVPGVAGDLLCTTTDGSVDEDNFICLP